MRPQGGENVGSVCRAIKNLGAGRLVVVAPEFDEAGAIKMAVHARDVYENRLVVDDLGSAVAGCATVIGTTARQGAYRDRSVDIRALCLRAADTARERVGEPEALPSAFVFGPEDSGLTNEDIAACHTLGFIPTSGEYESMNLAQAVVVTLYEFRRALTQREVLEPRGQVRPLAEAGEIEAMFEHLEIALGQIGFLSTKNPEHIMATLRALLSRTGLDEREVRVLRGLSRQVKWFAEGGREVAIEKLLAGKKLR